MSRKWHRPFTKRTTACGGLFGSITWPSCWSCSWLSDAVVSTSSGAGSVGKTAFSAGVYNRSLSCNAETKDFARLTSHPVRGWTGKNKAFCSPGTQTGGCVIKVYSDVSENLTFLRGIQTSQGWMVRVVRPQMWTVYGVTAMSLP